MFGSFFTQRNIFDFTGPVLIIDIRSSSVGGAIVEFSKTHPPLILRTHREQYFFETGVTNQDFFARAEIALKKVLETLIHKQGTTKSLRSVEIFYGAPWYKSFITNVQIEEQAPLLFTESFLEKLMGHEKLKVAPDEFLVEKESVAVLLNGYKLQQPLNKKATHFDISFYMSIISKETKDNFDSIIKKYIRIKNTHTHTHPLAMFKVLDKRLRAQNHYAIIDISGEMMELSIIKDGHFRKIIGIPYGSHSLVRALSKDTKTNFKTAFTQLSTILLESSHDKTVKENSAFKRIKEEWTQVMRKAIDDNKIELIPHTIFISGDEEIKELMTHMLSDVDVYAAALKINRKPNVQFIAANLLKNYCTYKDEDVITDHQIASESVFVELLRVKK